MGSVFTVTTLFLLGRLGSSTSLIPATHGDEAVLLSFLTDGLEPVAEGKWPSGRNRGTLGGNFSQIGCSNYGEHGWLGKDYCTPQQNDRKAQCRAGGNFEKKGLM